MCGRFTLTTEDYESVAEALSAEPSEEVVQAYRPRFNIAPTDRHWIARSVAGKRVLVGANWGFRRSKGGIAINARSDRLTRSRMFARAFEGSRCVVVADGFVEWQAQSQGKQPYWFRRANRQLLLLGGLFDAGAFAIITTESSADTRETHERMPLVLESDQVDAWLGSSAIDARLLGPAPEGTLIRNAVSQRVNSVRNDDAQCLEPAL